MRTFLQWTLVGCLAGSAFGAGCVFLGNVSPLDSGGISVFFLPTLFFGAALVSPSLDSRYSLTIFLCVLGLGSLVFSGLVLLLIGLDDAYKQFNHHCNAGGIGCGYETGFSWALYLYAASFLLGVMAIFQSVMARSDAAPHYSGGRRG